MIAATGHPRRCVGLFDLPWLQAEAADRGLPLEPRRVDGMDVWVLAVGEYEFHALAAGAVAS